ncbi:unnamed protein product, partial [Sphenostylis stenocarpa]
MSADNYEEENAGERKWLEFCLWEHLLLWPQQSCGTDMTQHASTMVSQDGKMPLYLALDALSLLPLIRGGFMENKPTTVSDSAVFSYKD